MSKLPFFVIIVAIIVLSAAGSFGQDAAMVRADKAPANAVWLDSLNLSLMHQGFGKPHACTSVVDQPLTLKGVVYPHGVGTHAASEYLVNLKGAAARFVSMVGVDDETLGKGSVAFKVYVDGKEAASTGTLHGGDEPKLLTADLTCAKTLYLVVSEAGDGNSFDHADWAGALIVLKPGATDKPEAMTVGNEPPPPIASGTKPEPAIHGPKIVGATPGRPFLFRIPATGDGPLMFSARNLPSGLMLDAKTGIIAGTLMGAGTTDVELTVSGTKGTAHRKLTIVSGDHKLALTPPMGWNSWYVWMVIIDDAKMRAAADGLVSSGLAAHGYQYLCIDDTWEGGRNSDGEIETNRKFPDMKALGDYIHAKGLKFGIYTSPGPKTCGGYTGSYLHEQQDANTFAGWGVDFLKHDWCSYSQIAKNPDLEAMKKPYVLMRQCLDRCGRDMVYSLCQYGMGDVWKWGAQIGANLWRTTGDMGNSWDAMTEIGFGQNGKEAYAGPGHWNDPDMLVVGKAGWGGDKPKETPLTPNEQITYVSLWCLLSAPLLISCDVSNMDQFTKDLLTNDEMIDVNQDPLGKQASRKAKDGWTEVWAKPMADGTLTVGLFNRGPFKSNVTAKWADLGLTGKQPVRDLWQQKDLPDAEGSFTASVPAHGAVVVQMGKAN